VVLVVWAVIGGMAAIRAPATPALLNIRGGSARETEASRTEKLLHQRFARPIAEFFAVTLEGPSRFDAGEPREVLDSLLAALAGQPYVRGLVSYPATGDSTFLSRDRRATFVLVAIDIENGDSAGAYVPPTRQEFDAGLLKVVEPEITVGHFVLNAVPIRSTAVEKLLVGDDGPAVIPQAVLVYFRDLLLGLAGLVGIRVILLHHQIGEDGFMIPFQVVIEHFGRTKESLGSETKFAMAPVNAAKDLYGLPVFTRSHHLLAPDIARLQPLVEGG
jgi:hypothetical protein